MGNILFSNTSKKLLLTCSCPASLAPWSWVEASFLRRSSGQTQEEGQQQVSRTSVSRWKVSLLTTMKVGVHRLSSSNWCFIKLHEHLCLSSSACHVCFHEGPAGEERLAAACVGVEGWGRYKERREEFGSGGGAESSSTQWKSFVQQMITLVEQMPHQLPVRSLPKSLN